MIAFGRQHDDTSSALLRIAQRVARRQDLASHTWLLAKARAAIGVALARRAARMVHSCMRRRCREDVLRLPL